MNIETLTFPSGSIRCQQGDYILQRGAGGGRIRVYRVEDMVKLSRLVPFGKDALIEEQTILDSERPAFMDEVHLLLTAFDLDFASLEEAIRAVEAGDLGATTEGFCLDIRRFPLSSSQVYRSASH
ncbi:MAG: hypothetical protein O8C63_12355 [Candidatus Methanoperedens sp.]|nr:hypothetical protein [Candidatus Methanoperedens sp.]